MTRLHFVTDGQFRFFYSQEPIVYKNELYLEYCSPSKNARLVKYDGNTFKFIYDPDSAEAEYLYYPIMYNSNLYYRYRHASNVDYLAKCDGSSLTLINNPDPLCSFCGCDGNPIIYNNNLYVQYRNRSYIIQLAILDSTSIIPVSTNFNIPASTHYKIYPDPATDRLFIENGILENATYMILFDITGKKINKQQLTNSKTEVSISNLRPGVYFLLFENSETIEVKKFIKI